MTDERYSIEFFIPELPRLQTNNYGSFHARNKDVKKWHALVALATHGKRPDRPLDKAIVYVTRESPRKCDFDNIVASSKPIVDGLVEMGILVDDNMDVIVDRGYSWKKVPGKKQGMRLMVVEIVDEDVPHG